MKKRIISIVFAATIMISTLGTSASALTYAIPFYKSYGQSFYCCGAQVVTTNASYFKKVSVGSSDGYWNTSKKTVTVQLGYYKTARVAGECRADRSSTSQGKSATLYVGA